MPLKTVTIIGATGLIGSHLVQLLQEESTIKTIRVLVRRPVHFSHAKVEVKLVDFSDPESFKLAIDGSDAVFCAVGTTQAKVKGNKAAYRKVDYDIPVNAARFCVETCCRQFLLVSSVGANCNSDNFYLKIKGEMEDAVRQQPIPKLFIFRPSLLLGDRKESRPGEKISQVIMPALSFLLVGNWSKYKPVSARDVAASMVKASRQTKNGFHLLQFNEMKKLIS